MNKIHKANRNHWWYRWIRSINWFAFRYWWFVWTLFMLGLLWYYFFCCPVPNKSCFDNEFRNRIDNINERLNDCCDCDETSIEDPLYEDAELLPADHLIITYQFDASGGIDLDTRTKINAPYSSLTLGCGFDRSDRGITWSGDNTGYGVESCHVDLTAFGSRDVIKIDCKAFWHGRRNSGDMSIDVRAYKGGTISQSDFQFINNGGEETGMLSFADNVSRRFGCGSRGEAQDIVEIIYHKPSQTLYFNGR